MLKVILVGYDELASSLMLGIIESKHELIGILRWEKTKENKFVSVLKDIFWPDKFGTLIKAYKINEIKAKSLNSPDFIKKALKLHPDVIIVGSWGEILKKKTIILPKIACINCHPSLLPKHRGSNPYRSVIKEGETKTGITFHLINEGIDTGPILIQKEINISDNDTGGSLRTKCSFKARETIKELLDGLENARFLPQKQDEKNSSHFPGIKNKDIYINWNDSPQDIYNQIRALNPWAKCYIQYKNQFLTMESSKIIDLKKPVEKPGKIIAKKTNKLLISTIDPYKAILLKNVIAYGFLSNLWSFYYINKIVRVGDCLEIFD